MPNTTNTSTIDKKTVIYIRLQRECFFTQIPNFSLKFSLLNDGGDSLNELTGTSPVSHRETPSSPVASAVGLFCDVLFLPLLTDSAESVIINKLQTKQNGKKQFYVGRQNGCQACISAA